MLLNRVIQRLTRQKKVLYTCRKNISSAINEETKLIDNNILQTYAALEIISRVKTEKRNSCMICGKKIKNGIITSCCERYVCGNCFIKNKIIYNCRKCANVQII